jgi:hypothetical protein
MRRRRVITKAAYSTAVAANIAINRAPALTLASYRSH